MKCKNLKQFSKAVFIFIMFFYKKNKIVLTIFLGVILMTINLEMTWF
jgi:hypothetical protein